MRFTLEYRKTPARAIPVPTSKVKRKKIVHYYLFIFNKTLSFELLRDRSEKGKGDFSISNRLTSIKCKVSYPNR